MKCLKFFEAILVEFLAKFLSSPKLNNRLPFYLFALVACASSWCQQRKQSTMRHPAQRNQT